MFIPAIISGILFVLTFLLVPETFFDREKAMGVVRETTSGDMSFIEKSEISRVETMNSQVFQPYTFTRSLKIGIYRPGLIKRAFIPYTTLLFPGTWMVMLHYAGKIPEVSIAQPIMF